MPPDPRLEVTRKAPPESLRQFGRNLSKLRWQAKLDLDQLAAKIDTTKRYVQYLESGQKSPTLFTLKKLKTALNCSYQDLLNGV